MSAIVRISTESHRTLLSLAVEMGKSMPVVLEQAIEALRRQRLLDEAATAYGKLRRDNKAWSEELAERKAWDKTLKDGLERA